MLGWFLYFTIDFKTESLINSERRSHLVYTGISRLLIIFEKKVFKTRAVPILFPIISFSSVKVIFSEEVTLSEKKPLKNFPKHFVACYIFFIKVAIVFNF